MIKRAQLIFLITLIAFCGSLVAALATQQERDFMLHGYVDATQDGHLPFRVPRIGVNAELLQYSREELTYQLDLMVQANIHWIRQFVWLDDLNTSQWDELITVLEDYPSLELVTVLMSQSTDAELFTVAAQDFVTRYGDAIDYYQIWDEPNLKSGWNDSEPRVVEYAALLQGAYTTIHNTDDHATVMAAALAPTVETGPDNINEVDYLRDLYAYGAADFTDAIAAKPYGFDLPPTDRATNADTLNFSRIIMLREVMVEQGDADKPLWASNWGWNSLPVDWSGEPSIWGEVSADEQVTFTQQALDRAEREWPWLGGMILYHWQPDAPFDDPIWGFALINQDDLPTPLWIALAERSTITTATNGLYAPQNPYARYSGIWTFSELGVDMGWVQDSQFEFEFTGADVALLLREDDYIAYFYPQVDNQPVNALPRDAAGNPYIILRSGTLQPQLSLVTVVSGLEDAKHTLRVTADELIPDEIAHRWPLVGYAVSSGNLATPYNRQITIAWLATVVALVSVVVTGSQLNWSAIYAPFKALVGRLNTIMQFGIGAVASLALLLGMLLTWGDGIPALFRRDSVQLALSILTSGLIYIEPGLLLTVIAALVLFVIIYNRLEIGAMLVIFWSPFFLFPVELYRFAFPLVEVLLLITFAAWALQALAHIKTSKPVLRPLDYVVGLWVGIGLLSLTWAAQRGIAITELRSLIIQPVMFYIVLRSLNRDSMVRVVDALIVAGTAVAIIGLIMWVRGESIITAEEGARRLASVYGSPNNVALFLGRCIPFALAFLLVKTDRNRRIFAGIALGVMLLALLLTQSAGGLFIGVPMAIAGVILLVWRRKALLPLGVLLVIGVIGLVIALQFPRFARVLDFTEGTNFYRLRVWDSAIQLIEDHPLTGVGLDQFLYAFRGQYILPDAWQEPNLSHPHNILLDFWVRLGLLGVGLLVLFQTFFWRTLSRAYRRFYRHSQPVLLAIIIGCMGSMLNLLAHGMVDNSVYVIDLAYVFVLLLATASNIGAIDEAP